MPEEAAIPLAEEVIGGGEAAAGAGALGAEAAGAGALGSEAAGAGALGAEALAPAQAEYLGASTASAAPGLTAGVTPAAAPSLPSISATQDIAAQGFGQGASTAGGAAPEVETTTAAQNASDKALYGLNAPSVAPGAGSMDYALTTPGSTGQGLQLTSQTGLTAPANALTTTPSVPGTFDKAISAITNNPLTAASLGMTGLSAYQGKQAAKALQNSLQQAGAQTSNTAQQLLNQYQTGTINPAQDKQITDWTNNQIAQIKQRYASMGRDPNTDSAAQAEMANAQAQGVAMRDQALQGVLTQGLNAAGIAAGPTTQAIMAGYNANTTAQNSMAQAMQTLAMLQALQQGRQ